MRFFWHGPIQARRDKDSAGSSADGDTFCDERTMRIHVLQLADPVRAICENNKHTFVLNFPFQHDRIRMHTRPSRHLGWLDHSVHERVGCACTLRPQTRQEAAYPCGGGAAVNMV